jgi:hypothetical protein
VTQCNNGHKTLLVIYQILEFLGLGPGLTPSGDDAITGLLVSLALTLKAYYRDALVTHPSKGIGSLILCRADHDTNAITSHGRHLWRDPQTRTRPQLRQYVVRVPQAGTFP